MKNKKAFTLVELIVVITILAILWTIAFLSFQWYSRDARDSIRIADIQNISKTLEITLTKSGLLPKPVESVNITASWVLLSYQWYINESILDRIWINNWWIDPLDNTLYTYTTNSNLTKYQLMWFLENWTNVWLDFNPNSVIWNTYARDLSITEPYTKWDQLGILLDPDSTEPVHILGNDVDIVNTNTEYKIYLDNSTNWNFSGTWNSLYTNLYHLSDEYLDTNFYSKLDKSLLTFWDMESIISIWWVDYLDDISWKSNYWTCYKSGTIVNCWQNIVAVTKNSQKSHWLYFDWKSDSLRSFPTNNTKSVLLVIYIEDKARDYHWRYLIDARMWMSRSYAALVWDNLWTFWLNIIRFNVNWQDIEQNFDFVPKNRWISLYIEYNWNFSDDINFMSRASNNEFLDWAIDEIRIYPI